MRFHTAALALLAALAACAPKQASAPTRGQTPIRFATDWRAEAEQGGFFEALATGEYARRGLDVRIIPGGPGANVPELIASGAADMGIGSNSLGVLNLAAEHVPVKAVMAAFQKDPQVLIAHSGVGVETLAEVKGHPILLADAAITSFWPWLKAKYGLSDSQVRKYSFSPAPFLADSRAVQEGYVTSEPYTIAQQTGRAPTVFLLADNGYPGYAAMVLAPDRLITSNPKAVRAFVEASAIGWKQYLEGDAAPADALILKLNGEMRPDILAQARAKMRQYGLVRSGDATTGGIGAMSAQRWKAVFEMASSLSLYPKTLDYASAYTTAFDATLPFRGADGRTLGWRRAPVTAIPAEPPRLSVVAPCYNEQGALPAFVDRMAAAARASAGEAFELVLVNDGSRDATWACIRALAHDSAHVVGVNLSRNHGHQLAVTAGLTLTRGARVLIIDADLQDPPEVLAAMMAKMDEGYDVVYGRRGTRQGESAFKIASAKWFYRILHSVSEVEIPQDVGDFRLMSRRIVDRLNAMPEQDRFLRGMVAWLGGRQAEVTYDRDSRVAGETNYTVSKMVRLAVNGLTGFSTAPLKIAVVLAFAGMGLAFLLMLYAVVGFIRGTAQPGWTSLALIMAFFGVGQLGCLAIIGAYLGRIYTQVKGRPLYMIDEVVGAGAAG